MATSTNQIIGVVMIVLGALLMLGWLDIPYLSTIIGVVLIVIGILALMGSKSIPKNPVLGVVLIVLGIIVLVPLMGVGNALAALLTLIVGILLVIGGILKLLGKW